MINCRDQQLLLECGYLKGSATETLQGEETTSDTEEEDALLTTSSLKVAKRLLHGQEQLFVEVAKAIYNTPLREEYNSMYFAFFFFSKVWQRCKQVNERLFNWWHEQ